MVKKLKKGVDIQSPFCYDINMMKNGVIEMNVAKTILSQIKALDGDAHSRTLSAMFTSQAAKVQPVLNTRLTQDYLKKRETLSRSKTTRTNGDLNTASNLSTPVPLYLTYTITGAVKENTYHQPMIDLLA